MACTQLGVQQASRYSGTRHVRYTTVSDAQLALS